MTNAVAADSISARANSGRRTSLRLGALLLAFSFLLPGVVLMTAGPAAATHSGGRCSTGGSTWPGGYYIEDITWTGGVLPNPVEIPAGNLNAGTYVHGYIAAVDPCTFVADAYFQTMTDATGSHSTNYPSAEPAPTAGLKIWRVARGGSGQEIAEADLTFPGSLVAPAPQPCDDAVLDAEEEWGGWGGGGTWGSGEDGSGPVAEHLKAWYWDPIAKAWTAWNGSYAELDAKIEEWVTLGYYQDGGGRTDDLDGWGGYGGGGSWGGNWTLACDTDADDVPDGFIAPEPTDGPMWEPLYPEGAQPITAPPAPAAPAPSGDCDFGITDPSSWLCGLAGLFGNLLDAIRWIMGWLGRLAGFLMDLLVPDPQVLQDSFTDVDTAWDASGPGQLTGGVTDIAAPILTMDENMPATCDGPQFTLPLPQSRSFTMNPLSTCGELTQYILGVVYPLETALIYLGGFFLGLRIVTRPFGMETPGTTQAASA